MSLFLIATAILILTQYANTEEFYTYLYKMLSVRQYWTMLNEIFSIGLSLYLFEFLHIMWRGSLRVASSHLGNAFRQTPFRTFRVLPASEDFLQISPACVTRLLELQTKKGQDTMLRITVDSGGCSGFQYKFDIETDTAEEADTVFEQEGGSGGDGLIGRVVVDEMSLDYLKGATVDWEEELIGRKFVVAANPNAASSCGCGVSFDLKL